MTFPLNAFHYAFRAFRCPTISVFFAGIATLGTCLLLIVIQEWVSQGKAGGYGNEEEEGEEHDASTEEGLGLSMLCKYASFMSQQSI